MNHSECNTPSEIKDTLAIGRPGPVISRGPLAKVVLFFKNQEPTPTDERMNISKKNLDRNRIFFRIAAEDIGLRDDFGAKFFQLLAKPF